MTATHRPAPAVAADESDYTARIMAALDDVRRQRGVSQAALADAAGISQGQVSKVMTGTREIRLSQLVAMCDLLGVRLSDVAAIAGV